MKQWIRWWGLAVFVGITLIGYLSIDSLIRFGIEKAGTQVVGAEVDVASTNFSLFPLGLTVNGLAITNPESPMENLWYSDSISLSLASGYLLRRQVIVDHAEITGLAFNTARKHSGAIDNRKKNKKTNNKAPAKITDGKLPDVEDVIASEKTNITAKFNTIEDQLKAIEQQWQKRLKDLPNKKTIAQYQKRWDALKKKDWLEKINDTKALQKDIENDLDKISELDGQLAKDKKKVNKLIKKAKNLPEKEADRLLANLGYSGGSRDLAKTLFSAQAKQWVDKLTGLLATASSSQKAEAESKLQRGEGLWVNFKEENPHPDFLIKHAKLSGRFDILGETINFSGDANNLTHQAKRWPHPADFKLNGNSAGGAKFSALGSVDLRQEPVSKMQLSFKQLAIKNLVLSTSESNPISLGQARLNADSHFSLKGETIAFDADSQFSHAEFVTEKSSDTTQQLIANTLKAINQFNLQLGMTGNINNPKLSINTDLDKALKKAVTSQASAEMSKYKDTLTKELTSDLSPQLSQLGKDADFLKTIKQQLADKESEIKGFSKGFF